jgi:hypothetical protein
MSTDQIKACARMMAHEMEEEFRGRIGFADVWPLISEESLARLRDELTLTAEIVIEAGLRNAATPTPES